MLVGAMASCNAKEEVVSSQAVEARDISLTLWGSEQDQDFLKEVSAEWATKYAAEHDDAKSVEVKVDIKGEDVATTDALNDITAAADVFGVGNNQLAQLTASNAIYKMPDSVVEQIKAVVGDAALSSTFCDGGYYGFPYAPNTANILFYNKSVFTADDVKTIEGML
ncbi:MAG: extracellular solute-binding protein, partial [Ruminococcus sp.]|nr:extracellular solute-binding protein [Ruminococcus sp.]